MSEEKKVAMDDIMLAMDVVDTLRRRKAMVDHELDADARERELVDKVKSIYAAQGIEVSDATIAEGVQALRDERFAYHPPPPGLMTRLGHLYVNRGKWFKRIGIAIAGLLAAWGIHWGTVTLPQQKAEEAKVEQLNQQLSQTLQQRADITDRVSRLRQQLQSLPTVTDKSLQTTAKTARSSASRLLDEAEQLTASASKLGNIPTLPTSASRADRQKAEQLLQRKNALLQQASAKVESTEKQISLLSRLGNLPSQLKQYKQEIDAVAKEAKARELAARIYAQGITALKEGDIETAQITVSDLKDLLAQLQQSYQLRIVSRPGERSGVWRQPDINTSARNYYLIVEAIDDKGRRLKLPITSEEDGKRKLVSQWGLRVDAATYNRVAADKKDDGIIQQNIVGEKQRGYLKPKYRIATSGAAITQW